LVTNYLVMRVSSGASEERATGGPPERLDYYFRY
jgi:hypothetical protein